MYISQILAKTACDGNCGFNYLAYPSGEVDYK